MACFPGLTSVHLSSYICFLFVCLFLSTRYGSPRIKREGETGRQTDRKTDRLAVRRVFSPETVSFRTVLLLLLPAIGLAFVESLVGGVVVLCRVVCSWLWSFDRVVVGGGRGVLRDFGEQTGSETTVIPHYHHAAV